jgi:hypothetical protein
MRIPTTTLQAVVLLIVSVTAYPGPGESPSPRFIFDPIKSQVAQCSLLGPEWRSRLATALHSAQSHTANLFPAVSWANLLTTAEKLKSGTTSNPQVDTCEKFVAYFGSIAFQPNPWRSYIRPVHSGSDRVRGIVPKPRERTAGGMDRCIQA